MRQLGFFRIGNDMISYEFWYSGRYYYRRFVSDRFPGDTKSASPIRISRKEYESARYEYAKIVALLDNGDTTWVNGNL